MGDKQNLGVFGPMGSGKGFAAKYLSEKYDYKIISMGNIVRSLAKKDQVRPTRENLEKVQRNYRDRYGDDFIIRSAIEKVKESKKPVILDGLRSQIDARTAKRELRLKIILVDADAETRFKRLKKRRRADFPRTFQEFKRIEALENKTFHLKETFKQADYIIDNSDGKKPLYNQLDALMKKLNK